MNQTPFNAAASNAAASADASYVFNVLILDESGSMDSIASAAKEVFEGYLHRLIQEQQDIPDLTQYINMWTFGKPYVNENIPLVKINAWDKVFPVYSPSGNTPMFDAIGMSIHKLKESIRILDLQKEQYQVKVFIVSDGMENASKEYSASQIGALIRGLIAEGWAFDYYGTDHDITSMADTLNIESHRRVMFQKSKAGMESARDQYMAEIMKEKMSFMESRRSDSSKK